MPFDPITLKFTRTSRFVTDPLTQDGELVRQSDHDRMIDDLVAGMDQIAAWADGLVDGLADLAEAWAESPDPPDPDNPDSKSAKTWAGIALLAADSMGDWRGPWEPMTEYAMGDRVQQNGSSYICVEEHVSGIFSADLAAGKWDLMAASGMFSPASDVTFEPTENIESENAQDAIEEVDANWRAGLAGVGLGITGTAPLLADLDATDMPAGEYSIAATPTTIGTRPPGWGDAQTGIAKIQRRSATQFYMEAVRFTGAGAVGIVWSRFYTGGAFSDWRRIEIGAIGQALWNDGANTTEAIISPQKLHATVNSLRQVYQVSDRKAQGTHGGGATAATWVPRDLNTVDIPDLSGALLSSNVVSLPAGVYDVDILAPAYNTGGHRCRLYNVTASSVLQLGTSEYSNTGDPSMTRSHIRARITLSDTTQLRIDHWSQTNQASNGLGIATGAGQELYTVARFTRLGAAP